MQSRMKKAALFVLAVLLLTWPMTASAEDEWVYDNYNRTALDDFAGSGAQAAWAGGDAGKSVSLEDNALKLEYASLGWFGTGGAIDASPYAYLKLTMKGAAGGEGADFDLNYAVGETVKTTGKPFSELIAAVGDPNLATEYQDIYIDLEANGIDPGIQAFHFNFHEGKSGTIWIDEIAFTKTAPVAEPPQAEPTPAAESGPEANADVVTSNPKTGDASRISWFAGAAAISGILLLLSVWKVLRTGR